MPTKIITDDQQFLLLLVESTDHIDNAIEYIKKHFSPEEIFPESELEDWAESHGFVKQDQTVK